MHVADSLDCLPGIRVWFQFPPFAFLPLWVGAVPLLTIPYSLSLFI